MSFSRPMRSISSEAISFRRSYSLSWGARASAGGGGAGGGVAGATGGGDGGRGGGALGPRLHPATATAAASAATRTTCFIRPSLLNAAPRPPSGRSGLLVVVPADRLL